MSESWSIATALEQVKNGKPEDLKGRTREAAMFLEDIVRADDRAAFTIANDLLLFVPVVHAIELTALDRLAREVANVAASVRNGLATRQAHPSYGYTKGSLTAQLDKLDGLVIGHMIASGAWNNAGDPQAPAAEYARDTFSLDLPGLRRAIKAA